VDVSKFGDAEVSLFGDAGVSLLWQVQYLVMLECRFSWQVLHVMMLEFQFFVATFGDVGP